jgi:hypothetical protein
MSSRLADNLGRGRRGGLVSVGEKGSVDDVGESAFEGPDGFFAGVASVFAALEVGAGVGVPVGLCERHAVDGAVELAVPDPA